MFCSNCGQPTEEGKRFCKYCGAPLAVPSEPMRAMGEQPTLGEEPTLGEQPTVGFAQPAAPPLGSPPEQPTLVRPGYGPGWGGPPGGRPQGGQGALIAGIIAATVVILAGIGVGAWLLVRDTGATDTTVVIETSTTATEVTPTSLSLDTTTSSSLPSTTSTTGYTIQDYLMAVGNMIKRLEEYDQRIPILAEKINQSAPDVPQGIYDELNAMMQDLEEAYHELGYMPLAPGFEEADGWLDEAIQYMDDRIWYTLQGIEAMWNGQNAKGAFDKGREARDNYREAMKKFWEVVPAG